MSRRPLAMILAVLATLPVQAQEMTEEVAILHRRVFERDPRQFFPDAAATRELAQRYLEGRGVEQDQLMACGLLFLMDRATKSTARDKVALLGDPMYREHCEGKSQAADFETLTQAACGSLGPAPQIFNLEPGAWVEIGPQGMFLDRPSGRTRQALPNLCSGFQYVLTRHVPLMFENGGRLLTRHFLEFLSWRSVPDPQGWRRQLEWQLWEVLDSRFAARHHVFLIDETGSRWPTPPVPEAYRLGASFSMSSGGEVRWRFDSDPPRSGIVGR